MRKIPGRFCTDANDFEGEGFDIKADENKKRMMEEKEKRGFLKPGAAVELSTVEGKIEIDAVLPIFEKRMYDYRGIINIDGTMKYIYFDHEDIKNPEV